MGTRVDPAVLLKASGTAETLGENVRAQGATVESDTLGAVSALPGFRIRQTVERLAFGWSDALGRHHEYLDGLGNALAAAAVGYRQSDDETAASFLALNRF